MRTEDPSGWTWILEHSGPLPKDVKDNKSFSQLMIVGYISKETWCISILNLHGRLLSQWCMMLWWLRCRISRSGHISVRIHSHFGLSNWLKHITRSNTVSNLCVVKNLTYLQTSFQSTIGIRLCENDSIFIYSVTKVINNQYSKIIKNMSFH